MTHGTPASLLDFGPRYVFPLYDGFASHTGTSLAPVFPFPALASHTCPHSSVSTQYRNIHLLSIGYGSRPHLRPRLSQRRSALLWKPWIFGRKDSHLSLATHSGILSSIASTAPYGTASLTMQCSSTNHIYDSAASAARFSPGHFRRRASRPVSYYALFECVAASEPTSWLSSRSHILFHLTRTLGPWLAVWAFSLLTTQLISCSLTPVHRLRGIRSLIFFGRL